LYCDIWIHAPADKFGTIDESRTARVDEEASWAGIRVGRRGRDDMGDGYVRTISKIDANHRQVPGKPTVQRLSERILTISTLRHVPDKGSNQGFAIDIHAECFWQNY
jgi:hypothetical protein